MRRRSLAALAAATLAALVAASAGAALPPAVARAFLEEGIPLNAVGLYVREIGAARPLLSHQATRPMNPASTMKLVTTFAALELLGADYRWKTEAYADGPITGTTLDGNLVLKGLRRPENHDRAIPGSDRRAARDRTHDNPRRPGARPQLLCPGPARSGGVRRRAAQTLQRRPRRIARQFQECALRLHTQCGGQRRRDENRASAREYYAARRATAHQRRMCRLALGTWRDIRQSRRHRRGGFRWQLSCGMRRARMVCRAPRPSALRACHLHPLLEGRRR